MSTRRGAYPAKHALDLANGHTPALRRILVVDDDTYVRGLCVEVLVRSGYQVNTAEDGEVAWKMLNPVDDNPVTDSYDLVIIDNNLPKPCGSELIKKLRSARRSPPVILASETVPQDMEWRDQAALLQKPFSSEQLLQAVKKVLH